jgi:hypothetical protein
MLHCNMTNPLRLQLGLDDLLADLRHARRQDDLGRLALIAYCEVRRWAREAGEPELAESASAMITAHPHASRTAFLDQVDGLIATLERLQTRFAEPPPLAVSGRSGPGSTRLGALSR